MVGSGPAGAVTALLLARWGARVVLVHDVAGGAPRPLVGEVLPPAGRPAFARLGLDALVSDRAHSHVPGAVAAWGPGVPAETDHLRSPFGEAVQVDRAAIERDLVGAAVAAGARLLAQPRATWGTWAQPAVDVGRRGPRVVVDATGRAAMVVRAGGATIERTDRLVAVVGILESTALSVPTDRRVFIAAEPDGWWSSMVLPDGRRIAAFHGDHDRLDPALRMDPDTWFTRLRSVPVLGPVVRAERWSGPARLRILAAESRRLCRADACSVDPPRGARSIVAVGDAEMGFDPLSSFGIMGAMYSAEEAVAVVTAMLDGRGGPRGPVARDAVAAREAARDRRWARYRERLALAYADETRWPDAPFWRRRRPVESGGAPAAIAGS